MRRPAAGSLFCFASHPPGYGFHLRSIYRDGYVLTRYEPSTPGKPNGLEEFWPQFAAVTTRIKYDGTEGELYDLRNDPRQWENLWDDPGRQGLKRDLIGEDIARTVLFLASDEASAITSQHLVVDGGRL